MPSSMQLPHVSLSGNKTPDSRVLVVSRTTTFCAERGAQKICSVRTASRRAGLDTLIMTTPASQQIPRGFQSEAAAGCHVWQPSGRGSGSQKAWPRCKGVKESSESLPGIGFGDALALEGFQFVFLGGLLAGIPFLFCFHLRGATLPPQVVGQWLV